MVYVNGYNYKYSISFLLYKERSLYSEKLCYITKKKTVAITAISLKQDT